MIVGNLALGLLAGILASALTALAGMPLISVLLVYWVFGTVGFLMAPTLVYLRDTS